jgi:hypothetical protein
LGEPSKGRLGAVSWSLLIHLKSNRDEIVYFDSQNEAEAALDKLLTQMGSGEGFVTISGSNNKTVVNTGDIETARVYE